MKTFAGVKTLDTIKAQCAAQGVPIDTRLCDKHGWDTIVVGGPILLLPGHPASDSMENAYAIFNTFNGKFFGRTHEGVSFDSSSTEHESEPWFQALLSFFYVEKGEAGAAPRAATMVELTLGGVALLGERSTNLRSPKR